jgi:cytoskeletal protein CcmA (bactofilin family)
MFLSTGSGRELYGFYNDPGRCRNPQRVGQVSLAVLPGAPSFTWHDTFNGDVIRDLNGSGGITCIPSGACGTLNSSYPAIPGSGSGGITITSINGAAVTSLPSGGSCNGVFDGTVNGSVTVSANQNCTLTNACEITGNVTVDGGSLALDCTVDGNLTATGGSLFLGGAAHVKGNFNTSQASALTVSTSAIDGNLRIQGLSGAVSNTVCGTQLKGNLQAQTNAAPLNIGGTTSQGCSGNTISGNLTVSDNTAALQVDSNTVGGNLTVNNDTSTTDVSGNSVGGNLQCQNDTTVTHVALNSVKGNNQGQCAAFP